MSETVIEDILREKIASSNGSIDFATYMETVLYLEKGYYQNEQPKIGKQGDFYTSSSVHPVFAWIFADYFEQYCLNHDLPFRICELGGGTGAFAEQVLDYVKKHKPDRYKELVYEFVEISSEHKNEARSRLSDHNNVTFHTSIAELQENGPYRGIIFSNELLDALPVHVVEKKGNALFEVKVSFDEENGLYELLEPLSDERVLEWLAWSGLTIPEGHRIEIPLSMMDWLDEITHCLGEGLLVTVDYGYQNDELLQPELRNGTLRGYYKHQMIENSLSHPGKMDLTTHIHFDALIEQGKEKGLQTEYFGKQREFLLEHGLFQHLVEHDNRDPFSEVSRLNRAIRSFASPGGISEAFHVLVQKK
ncbi:class I SAM-dependent methyltransferase [Pseudalkalibacillus sp. Hm43]|uniref:class I SAM-dependent methyltransferase n=1 Tax=Pseudalkalibacillus sp. Hm43 TaxID=3450742 RepID=UPI003F4425A4